MNDSPVTDFGSTGDGLSQLRRRWEVATPKAALLIVHGIGEHSGRYLHVGQSLATAGYDVLAYDIRGFGQTGGARAAIDSWDQYLDDVQNLLEERRALGVPVVLLGYSMGGLIATSYLVSDRPQPDVAVLSAPALVADVPRWQRLAAPVLGRLAPKLFIKSKIDGELLSRDPAVQDAYLNDPLVVSGATAGLGLAMFEAMEDTSAVVDRVRVPTYVLHGDSDRLVPPRASEGLGALPNVERRLWAGVRHEAFNEPEQDEVLAEVAAWLDDQVSSSST